MSVSCRIFTFQVRRESDPKEGSEHILALNKNGVSFLDLITHETTLHYPFTEVRIDNFNEWQGKQLNHQNRI